MGEDAAAAARRIVEEVLAHAGSRSGDGGESASPTAGTSPAAARAAAADEPARRESPGAPTTGRGEDTSEAGRIARRIVEDALAAATQTTADASVRGVPREGLAVPDERTAQIHVPPEEDSAETRQVQRPGTTPTTAVAAAPARGDAVPTTTEAGPSEPEVGPTTTEARSSEPEAGPTTPEAGGSDGDSAQDIVRRIVAEVQAGEQDAAAPPDPEAVDAGHPPAPEAASGPGTLELPADGEAVGPPGPGGGQVGGATSTQAVSRPEAATGVEATVEVGPFATGPPDPGEEAQPSTAPTTRPLVGWADPPEPVDLSGPATPEPAARTLRWLLASLLGAVALAVLFPLAVAALRALVSLG